MDDPQRPLGSPATLGFRDRVAWITGASSGIGRSLALALDRAGARLILSARDARALDAVRAECTRPADVRILPFDLSGLDGLAARAADALGCFGYVDYMVHNAGVAVRDRAVNIPLEIDQRVMATNYLGPVALTKALLPAMLARGSGCFVVVSSLSGKHGVPQLTSYAAAKHALHGFFDSLRAEVHGQNIQITIVIPGIIRTPIIVNALTGSGGTYGKSLPSHDGGMSPDECAERILAAVARRKEEVAIGGPELLSLYVKRYFPSLFSLMIRSHPVRLRNRLLAWFTSPRQQKT